jgi:hypothetical protein
MVLKIVGSIIGAIIIIGLVIVGPDLKRYMKIRSM